MSAVVSLLQLVTHNETERQHGSLISTLVFIRYWDSYCLPLLSLATMLALITKKLQNQTLDDSSNANSTHLTNSSVDSIPSTTQSSLAVKGRNVWTLSVKCSEPVTRPAKGDDRYRKLLAHKPSVCDTTPGTPTAAPPTKKYCRSLSVPADPSIDSLLHTQGSKLWRPIPVIPVTNNNTQQPNLNFASYHSECPAAVSFTHTAPAARSPLSVDSGHFTTSDLLTPPGSPVPRSASALSDVSYGSWLEHSPSRSRFEILQKRSLSYEDQISNSSQLTSVSLAAGGDVTSATSVSPYRHKIPRCRSQPCVLHDRRFGKKRRRECDRPTLNFHKMTETAYCRNRTCDSLDSRGFDLRGFDLQKRTSTFREELESAVSLMPIASSPRDSDFTAKRVVDYFSAGPTRDMSHARGDASTPLSTARTCSFSTARTCSFSTARTGSFSTTRTGSFSTARTGSFSTARTGSFSTARMGSFSTARTGSFSDIDICEPVRLVGDDDESGCGCQGDAADNGAELFPLTDLDIEQIESH